MSRLTWIQCPIACSDPTHTIKISIDSEGVIRTIKLDCDANDLDVAKVLGNECCLQFLTHFRAYVRESDYDRRAQSQRSAVAMLQGSRHVNDTIRWALADARDRSAERPRRAAIAAPKFEKALPVADKILEFNAHLASTPYRLERAWSRADCWAVLAIDRQPLASIAQVSGQRSVATLDPFSNFYVPTPTETRTTGKRKQQICSLCKVHANKNHAKQHLHALQLRMEVKRVLQGLGFEVPGAI